MGIYLEAQHPRGHGGKWADSSATGGSKGGFWSRRKQAKAAKDSQPSYPTVATKMHSFPCTDSNGEHEPGCPHDEEDYD